MVVERKEDNGQVQRDSAIARDGGKPDQRRPLVRVRALDGAGGWETGLGDRARVALA